MTQSRRPSRLDAFVDPRGRRWLVADHVPLGRERETPDDAFLFYAGDEPYHHLDDAAARAWRESGVGLRTIVLEARGRVHRGLSLPMRPERDELRRYEWPRFPGVAERRRRDQVYAEARVVGGRVDAFYTEGGWAELGWAVPAEGSRSTDAAPTTFDVRAAIGSGWRKLTMADATDVWLDDIVVTLAENGAFRVSCDAVGDVTALVEKYRANPPANPFCNDSTRTKRLSFTWDPGDGAPREWLRLELTRTALEPGSHEWAY